MTESEKKQKRKKWFNYVLNTLLIVIVLILIIPSWRSAFQTWFTSNTLTEVTFKSASPVPMPQEQKNWELFNVHGEMSNFADYQGKPMVIQFWATWCTYCKAAFPDLGDLRENFNNDIIFLAVTTESIETLQRSGYADEYDFLYCSQQYPDFFEVSVYPTLVILDRNMSMVYRMEGAGDINNEENIAFLKGLR